MTDKSALANPENLDDVQRWLDEYGEVFLIISGYHTRYALVDSLSKFENITRALSGRTEVYVFRERQLPLRGVADETMRQEALKMMGEPEDFLILSLENEDYLENDWFHGDMRWELRAKFEDFFGKRIAFGKMPPWWDEQNLREQARHLLFLSLPLRELRIDLRNLESGDTGSLNYPLEETGWRSKLGGKPDWIQSDYTPDCPSCSDPMHFVYQIDSIDHVLRDNWSNGERPTYMFGDAGMIYVFFCFECSETESVFQCY